MKQAIRELLFPALKNAKSDQAEIEKIQHEIESEKDRPREELLGLVKDMLSDLAHDT